MENSIRKTLFVEFYGLPGCGKTTVSHLVAERLRQDGIAVNEPSYNIDHCNKPIVRKIKKFCLTLCWLFIYNKSFREISSLVKYNGYNWKERIEQITNIIQKIKVYTKSSGSQIVIWDQGLVQAAISLSMNGRVPVVDNYRKLKDLISICPSILYFSIDVDEKVAIERMAKRGTTDSRVEKIRDNNQQYKVLCTLRDSVMALNKELSVTPIDGFSKVAMQTDDIYGFIVQKKVNE